MSKLIFQFRLKKADGSYYQVSPGGIVTTSPTPVNLSASVVDWDVLQLSWIRHKKYHGVFRIYTPDTIRFANDAAKILRYVFNAQGYSEAVCFLEIMKLKTADQLYYQRGICAIDFSTMQDFELYVDAHLMDGGMSAKLNGYDTTVFGIDLEPPVGTSDSQYLLFDGVMLQGSFRWQTFIDPDPFTTGYNVPINISNATGSTIQESAGIVFLDQEGSFGVGTGSSSLPQQDVPGGIMGESIVFTCDKPVTVTFSMDIEVRYDANVLNTDDVLLRLNARVYNPDWSHFVADYHIWTSPGGYVTAGGISGPFPATVVWTITFAKGDVMALAWNFTISSSWHGLSQVKVYTRPRPMYLIGSYNYQPDTVFVRAFNHWSMFKKLFQQLVVAPDVRTVSALEPISDLLTTDVYPGPNVFNLSPVNTFFTSGDGLRELYIDAGGAATNPQIKMTIADFAQDALVTLGAGLGIEKDGAGNEVLRLEKLKYFYQKDVLIADLGDKISNWHKYPYTDYLSNNVKNGYQSPSRYNDLNGNYEFNDTMNWITPILRTQEDLNFLSPLRHDCYGATYTQLNFSNKTTTDSESDNDTFKIQSNGNRIGTIGLSPDPWQIDRAQTIISGLPVDIAPTVFNVPFTPGRNRGRLTTFLKSVYYGLIAPVWNFVSGPRNTKLVSSMFTGPIIDESASPDFTSGPDDELLFKPVVFEFEAQVPIDLPDLMATNPYGVFRLKYKGVILEGFVLEAGINDATNNIFDFKLLCSPDTVILDRL